MPPIGLEVAPERVGQNRSVPGVSPSERLINIFLLSALPAPLQHAELKFRSY